MFTTRNEVSPQSRDEEPIAALASGSGGAIAVLRLSGKGSHDRLGALVSPLDPSLSAASLAERRLSLCRIIDPISGDTLDEALVALFHAPRSFTGEDAAEIHAHGGPYVVRRILQALYSQGFRPADPGEFTRRAYLNGKLDLTTAEGIKELVEADSHQQWMAARQLATGRLRQTIDELRTRLIEALAYLEAQIDFPDEGDTSHLERAHVLTRAEDVTRQLDKLLSSYSSGRVASRGLMVALTGAPNAGKSTLMNELLGHERAIVTPIAGTTRDWLEERCLVHGRLLRLVDMAGLRPDHEAVDPVEVMGIETAKRLASEAELVLFLVASDSSEATLKQVEQWTQELRPKSFMRILTKSDLGVPTWAAGWPAISCKNGAGLDELRQVLADKVDEQLSTVKGEEAFVTSARHVAALKEARAALQAFFAAEQRGDYVEMLAFELQEAVRALRSIVGEISNDDILDKIFREFCVGK